MSDKTMNTISVMVLILIVISIALTQSSKQEMLESNTKLEKALEENTKSRDRLYNKLVWLQDYIHED